MAELSPQQVPEYFTFAEVAERYRTTEGTVRYWRHIGFGPRGVKFGEGRGGKVLFPRAEVERFDRELAERAAVADPPTTAASSSRHGQQRRKATLVTPRGEDADVPPPAA